MYQLIINLKTYDESSGINVKKIAKACIELKDIAKRKKVEIILCPELIDLREVVKLGVKVYAQHIDIFESGAHTGYVIAEHIKGAGAVGTLISHSEHMLSLGEIKDHITMAKLVGLQTCVCARNDLIAEKISKFKPDFIAVEPKELIGGDISISKAKPDLIKKSLKSVGKVPLLVGAGVKNYEDVKVAIGLGAQGILVASGVVKAKDPKLAIEDLLSGF